MYDVHSSINNSVRVFIIAERFQLNAWCPLVQVHLDYYLGKAATEHKSRDYIRLG